MTLNANGRRHEISKRRTVLGRQGPDIQIEDANVSRRHAELRQEGTAYWIVDLDSTNGVEINGRRVKRKLDNGDTINRLHGHRLRPRAELDRCRSIAVDEALLVLKVLFLVLLYLFIGGSVARRAIAAAAGELHPPAEQAEAAGLGAAARGYQTGVLVVLRSPALEEGASFSSTRRRSRSDAAGRTTSRSRATSSRRRGTLASSRGATACGCRTAARPTARSSTARGSTDRAG